LALSEASGAATTFRTWVSATSVTAQVASSGVTKLALSAQNDGATWGMLAPFDLDITKQIRWRVHFTQTADSGTVTFAVKYLAVPGDGSTVIAAPTATLDTAIPAYTTALATDNLWLMTDFGVILRNTIPQTTDALVVQVLCTDSSPNAGLGILGVEMRYSPRRTQGQERNLLGGRRLVTTRPLGVLLAPAQEGR
jgi:hypothetical protein